MINAKQLQLLAHTHISEALSQVPGVWLNRGNGQEHLTAIRSPVLTGAGSCGAFSVLEDSAAVRATGFCNVNNCLSSIPNKLCMVQMLYMAL